MHNFLRLTLLGLFAATGVGLAIAVATQEPAALLPFSNPAPPASASRAPQGEAPPSPAKLEPARPLAATAPEWVIPPSAPAPYQPAVTAQFDALRSTADQLREATQAFKTASEHMLAQAQEPRVDPRPAPAPAPEPLPAVPARAAKEKAEQMEIHAGEGDDSLSVNLQNADLRQVLESFSKQGHLNILASKSVQGSVSATLNGVDLPTALDAILKSTGYVSRREGNFVYVGTAEDLQLMDQARDHQSTRVYRPNYAKAADLQALITPMLTKGVGFISVSAPSEIDIPADNVKTGGNSLAGQDVVLVRDYETVLARIDQVVSEVDQKPLQVAIEAMILSVKLNDTTKAGVDFALLRDRSHVRLTSGSPLADLADIDVSSGGLKFGFLDSSLGVFIEALETVGDTNVVASPRLMCLNKQRAEILIGSQLGYVSTTVTENSATQTIDFLEVGTQLRFRPYISADGMIRLEVHPELSTGTVKVESGFTLPSKEVTQVTTNIMCRDGCTVVIGGLIREDLSDSRTQIPWLGSLPLVGPAFRHRDESNDRSEVIVLLTPHIVCDDHACQEGAGVACDFEQRRDVLINEMSPLGKRYLGRRHLGLAQAAWNAGQQKPAEHHLKLALHYDPANLAVIKLRNEMLSAGALCGSPPGCITPWQSVVGESTPPTAVISDDELPTPAMETPTPVTPPKEARRATLGPPKIK